MLYIFLSFPVCTVSIQILIKLLIMQLFDYLFIWNFLSISILLQKIIRLNSRLNPWNNPQICSCLHFLDLVSQWCNTLWKKHFLQLFSQPFCLSFFIFIPFSRKNNEHLWLKTQFWKIDSIKFYHHQLHSKHNQKTIRYTIFRLRKKRGFPLN